MSTTETTTVVFFSSGMEIIGVIGLPKRRMAAGSDGLSPSVEQDGDVLSLGIAIGERGALVTSSLIISAWNVRRNQFTNYHI